MSKTAQPSITLLARVARGDEDAVGACMDRFGGLVWSLARRYLRNDAEAADAVQEIFIELWQNAKRYDPERGSEETFVAVLTRRRLIDRLRKLKRQPRAASLAAAAEVASDPVDDPVQRSEEAQRVMALIEELKPEQQRVLKLAVVEGWTHQHIADQLAMPLGTVKTHVRRGLMRVRDALARKERQA